EEAATALAEAGDDACDRCGFGSAAAAFERAAQLSPSEDVRIERMARAAECAWRAGSTGRAIALLDESLAGKTGAQLRARLLHVRGRLEVYTGSHGAAYAMLLEGGGLVEAEDPVLAAVLIGDAVEPCYFLGDVDGCLDAAQRARALAPRDGTFADVHAD